MKPLFIILPLLTFCCYFGCSATNANNAWPDISFVVLDEIPNKHVFERTHNFVPTVKRVVLLPIVENYSWNGKRHTLALADPIVVEPGKEPLRKTLAALEVGRQAVRRCIVLAPGYCPGTLQPTINYAGMDGDKQVWLVELAKVSDDQFKLALLSIVSELGKTTLRVGREMTFEAAIKEKKLLSTGELLSPVLRSGNYRNTVVLWNVPAGTEVAICLSQSGIKSLISELQPTQ